VNADTPTASPSPDRQGTPARAFPAGFLWGSATAAHQVEGNNTNNDWWAAEQAGRVPYKSGLACDQWSRYDADFALFAELGQTAHRLSIEWSRIEPRPGELDFAALAHYRRVLESLRAHGLEPIVTLHHFANPIWLAEQGGWTRREVVGRFARYARRVVREYKDLVKYWVTINEPGVYAGQGYLVGVWPPNRLNDVRGFRAVLRHMAMGHARAYHAMKAEQTDAKIGVAHHYRLFDPATPERRADRLLAALRNRLMNQAFGMAIHQGRLIPPLGDGRVIPWMQGTEDWVGVNYYTRQHDRFALRAARMGFGVEILPEVERNQLGWEIYAKGLERAILMAAPPGSGREVMVTENGVPEPDDQDVVRPRYLVQHLAACHRAIQAGANLKGYVHWTGLDNFEWAEGFNPHFGLVHVDFETQERTPKPSAYLYRDIIRRNGLSADEIARYDA
jgi:beta-glucosidase